MKSLAFFIFISFSCFFQFSTAIDTLTPSQSIRDGETLISTGQRFELGFFSPSSSKNRYLGIWYRKTPQVVVWVANRNDPLTDSNGLLTMNNSGSVFLINQENNVFWSSSSSTAAKGPVAQLLETGNFVVRESNTMNSQSYFWQSFDYPTDTRLPGMKMGKNSETDKDRYLSSWKSIEDPSIGESTYRIENLGLPQTVIRSGTRKFFRSGTWNGLRFTGLPMFTPTTISVQVQFHHNNFITMCEPLNNRVITRLVLTPTGVMYRYVLDEQSSEWIIRTTSPVEPCDSYGFCGANAVCSSNKSPMCECLEGFKPKSEQELEALDWSSGCVRKVPLDCKGGDGFVKVVNVKLPDLLEFYLNTSMGVKECESECLKDCSCSAYAKSNMSRHGNGCLIWYGNLIDIREFVDANAKQDMYIRLPSSEIDSRNASERKRKRLVIVLVLSTMSGILFLVSVLWYIIGKKRRKTKDLKRKKEELELPSFDLATIVTATENFSEENMVGEGGFGPVYKGHLLTGEKVAVKRLSKNSLQGLEEFKNEVILIAKLQHRNLVRLLGCCIQNEERMLIYEFMPNKSLDYFIFDEIRSTLLDWKKRYEIAMGISRGLLYLHQDSRLRIIHRDLKTSNVLLDDDLNPKISDFGLARIFGEDQIEAKTKRIIGTYGYMSPEYAIDGKFSFKSDVFSLGVILLEIVSGKKNRAFQHQDHHHNLLGHAWLLWRENKALDMVDDCFEGLFDTSQALRCIQVGLLCVQKYPRERPDMSSVVFMLGNEVAIVPQPKEPGFFHERSSIVADTRLDVEESCTDTSLTVTVLEAR